jgi:2-methylcitrate dehydratase PrpD
MSGTTRELARFLVATSYGDLPEAVQREGTRAFLNWLGCVFGGLGEPAGATGYHALGNHVGPGEATVIGRKRTADPVSATFFNVLGSSSHGYDDAHLATVTHPSGPAAGAALAAAEITDAAGSAIVNAVLLGIEVQCRVATALVSEPGISVGFYMTGLTGALGAAAAAGKLFDLDEQRMNWALGIAAAQGGGFRETHGSMANALIRAQAARNGMMAALLARDGFTCTETALEGKKGFMAVLGSLANTNIVTDGLGRHFELVNNTYKAYPCAMPVNPIIDACLDILERAGGAEIEAVALTVSPLAMELAGRESPKDVEEARVSLFHWAAASLARGRAGLDEIQAGCVVAPDVLRMRSRIGAKVDRTLSRESASAVARLKDGRELVSHVADARGSIRRPMSNAELEQKFGGQASRHIDKPTADKILSECWALPTGTVLSQRLLTRLIH